MAAARLVLRSSRAALSYARPFSASAFRFKDLNERGNDNVDEHRKRQMEKPLNPHMTNTTSTIANELPSIGKDGPPPEMLSSVDPNFVPKDAVPEKTQHMTGGTQKGAPEAGVNSELQVGELEGAKFRIEPIQRVGEDSNTMRARLIYQSRKRGILESDLLLSTFADANLGSMSAEELREYDRFLDENDWDIYYWATQEPAPTSRETAEGSGADLATPTAQGKSQETWSSGQPKSGEWAQTVGTFKPAYRPVPQRWKNSTLLTKLREHVRARSAGGVHPGDAKVGNESAKAGTGGGGLGRMPELKTFDQ
ncbi:TPR domain-containing protein [Lasiodiplodia theobromae]|uniref:TPR domain-containing protein n=1 Tax=Lasiodiplodia theobromae TaxID=45133 RepID=UPI0015C40DCA|nr:TPR domain-containing protein [Lasiodiplodia theobromae]KAF4541122.1 TPR domain-containing protein [Lasiodiplodia theobromae]